MPVLSKDDLIFLLLYLIHTTHFTISYSKGRPYEGLWERRGDELEITPHFSQHVPFQDFLNSRGLEQADFSPPAFFTFNYSIFWVEVDLQSHISSMPGEFLKGWRGTLTLSAGWPGLQLQHLQLASLLLDWMIILVRYWTCEVVFHHDTDSGSDFLSRSSL